MFLSAPVACLPLSSFSSEMDSITSCGTFYSLASILLLGVTVLLFENKQREVQVVASLQPMLPYNGVLWPF